MSLSIRSNISSLQADRQLARAQNDTSRATERLSSGSRINKASDDAAGLAIALQLASQSGIRDTASRNISDGVSLSNIAEGALNSASEITTRLSELSAQASSSLVNDEQRAALNDEFQALRGELDRISSTTEFNGQNVFGGETSIQTGTTGDSSSSVSVNIASLSADELGLPADILSVENARSALDSTKDAISQIGRQQGDLGAFVSRLESSFNNNQTQQIEESAAESRIRDADIASESGNLAAANIRQQASVAVKAQANIQPQVALQLLS